MKKVRLNEARGIAESTVPYTHAVMNVLDKHLAYFFNKIKDEEYLEITKDMRGMIPDYSTSFDIPYRHLARYIDDDIFEDFPLAKIDITLKMALIDREGSGDDSPSGGNFAIGGGAWPVYKRPTPELSYRTKPENFPISKKRRESIDRVLVGKLDFDITIYNNFEFEKEHEALDRELLAVVFHELHHLYEGYKDKTKDEVAFIPKTLEKTKLPRIKTQTSKAYLTDTKLVGIPTEVKDLLIPLFNLYYYSLPSEVKAITQEMYPFVLKMSVDDFFKSFQGMRVKSLMDFDAEIFYDRLIDSVIDYYDKKGVDPTDEQIHNFFNQVRARMVKTYIEKANNSHEIIDQKFVSKKDLKSLIIYMGKQIEKGGQKLFRNVGRLYSLKMEAQNG